MKEWIMSPKEKQRMNDKSEIEKQTEILLEMLKWIKFSGMKDVKEVLLSNLTDDTKKIVYHYSNGENNTTYLKQIANVSGNNVIPNLWNKWKNIGIIEKISVKGGERGKKIFNLEDFGIPIPSIVKIEEPNAEAKAEERKDNKISGNNVEEFNAIKETDNNG